MNRDSCSRWVLLSDREICGESLSPAEAQFCREHARRCLACAAETRFYSKLDGILSNPDYLDAHVATVPVPRNAQKFYTIGAFAAAAALTLGWFGYSHFESRRKVVTTVSSTATGMNASKVTATLVAVFGQVELAGQPTKAGQRLQSSNRLNTRQGQACVAAATRINSCLDERSEAHWSLEDPREIQIDLARGRVLSRLDKRPENRPFAVQTAAGRIVAKGTVFSVSIEESGQVTVQLHEGRLWLESTSKESTILEAPAMATLNGTIKTLPLSDTAQERDRALLTLSNLTFSPRKSQDITRLEVVTQPEAAQVTLDGTVLGHTPLSAFVPTGKRLAVELPGYAPVAELLPTNVNHSLERRFELSKLALPTDSAKEPLPAPPATIPSALELFERAQQARAQGKYAVCANTYRQLLAAHPNSNEAHVSMVSLGELELP